MYSPVFAFETEVRIPLLNQRVFTFAQFNRYVNPADHGVMMPLYYQEFIPEGVPQVCRTWTTQDRSETYALENTT